MHHARHRSADTPLLGSKAEALSLERPGAVAVVVLALRLLHLCGSLAGCLHDPLLCGRVHRMAEAGTRQNIVIVGPPVRCRP